MAQPEARLKVQRAFVRTPVHLGVIHALQHGTGQVAPPQGVHDADDTTHSFNTS